MNIKKCILNISFIFAVEMIFHFILFKSFDIYLLYILGFSIFIGTFISIICSIGKNKINKILNIIFISLITLIFIAQLVHFKFYNSIFLIYSLVNG